MPINRRSINMLESTGTTMNQYSTEVKGDAYYGYSDGFHTIQVIYNQFIGRLRIQATLDLTPETTDWFDIIPTTTAGTEFSGSGCSKTAIVSIKD